jgi:hypothetical protein
MLVLQAFQYLALLLRYFDPMMPATHYALAAIARYRAGSGPELRLTCLALNPQNAPI